MHINVQWSLPIVIVGRATEFILRFSPISLTQSGGETPEGGRGWISEGKRWIGARCRAPSGTPGAPGVKTFE